MKLHRNQFFLALALTGLTTQAHGVGFGVYAKSGSGNADFDGDSLYNVVATDTEQSAFGFMFDTKIVKPGLFNYRLGLEKGTLRYKGYDGDLEMDEVAMTHDFGFTLMHKPDLRLWAGPQLRISVQDGSTAGNTLSGAGFGLGPVLGMNWRFTRGLALTASAGYLQSFYSLDGDVTYTYSDPSGYSYSYTVQESYSVTHQNTFLNVGLAFTFE